VTVAATTNIIRAPEQDEKPPIELWIRTYMENYLAKNPTAKRHELSFLNGQRRIKA
jgi:hypothetical protein